MNASEKLRKLAEFAETGEVFQIVKISDAGIWLEVQFTTKGLVVSNVEHTPCGDLEINYFINHYNIRSIPKLPKLTDEEKLFLGYASPRWYLSRDKDGSMVMHADKPFKNTYAWTSQTNARIPFHPGFTDIKWSDEDCYTIGELRNQK